ncbi:glycosyl hydrolase family 18 protein [Aureivirga marina]|uniref:glycosyl hydrolase family 18 protein n=1 Tax=Aureivirga marina TaxID=1182451 RepID=UPI0018CB5CC8|nr:glycosyl hydrolase family 18 protein [Aureivirga marina]
MKTLIRIYWLVFIFIISISCDNNDDESIITTPPNLPGIFSTTSYVTGYLDTDNYNNLTCFYLQSDTTKSPFNHLILFAANIAYDATTEKATIYVKPELQEILDNTDDLNYIKSKGIKISVAFLGHHENAGWSCFSSPEEAEDFADQLQEFVTKYNLDGISIDDEYSGCSRIYDDSVVQVSYFIKQKMPDKLLTFAMTLNDYDLKGSYEGQTMADILDYAFDATYVEGDANSTRENIQYYMEPPYNFPASKLSVGLDASLSPGGSAGGVEVAKELKRLGAQGPVFFGKASYAPDYTEPILEAYIDEDVGVKPNCIILN